MIFSYTIKSKDGEIVEDVTEGKDRFSVMRELRARGLIPFSISEKKPSIFDLNTIINRLLGRIKISEKIIFTKNLSGMLKAGLSLSRALSVLQKQTKNPEFIRILNSISSDINSGGTFSLGLAKFPKIFSKLFVSMVRAGEESGNLANSLSEIGMNLEKANALTKRIKGAMMYPSVIMCAMILIGVLMFAFVVPTLANTFKSVGVALPVSTQIVIGLGNFFSQYLLLSLISIFAIIFGTISLLKAPFLAKYIDFMVIRLPLIGTLTKELNTARTARTISSLLLSGVSITRAIEITEDVVQNIYYKKVLEDSKIAVEKGAPFFQSFEDNPKLFPVMMSEMIQVGEETGKLSNMLLEVALFYEGEIENKTKNLSTIIEPVLMIFIGGAVGFFAISMITPLYSIMDTIK